MNQRQLLTNQVVGKAMKDDAFKRLLLADPKAAIASETGMLIPDHFNLTVLEEEPGLYYLIVPPLAAPEAEKELTEMELEAVAGGNDIWTRTPVNDSANRGAIICS